jgi:lipopolysaccharide/colanic/teichoic acid biosynthesis glycosyltransferase
MHGPAYDPLKRVIDVVGAVLGLVATAPMQVLIAALVRLKFGSPVLFRQLRPGRDERTFELVKFRTMHSPDSSAGLTTDAERLTSFGAKLRSTSLDELPTLWNVLRGDMSLVGPRPLLVQYLDRYNVEQRRRHEVRPGITGLAQVSGRNNLAWDRRFRLDVDYVDRRSFALDLKIMRHTLFSVLRREGIRSARHVTMPEFRGAEARRGETIPPPEGPPHE